MDNQIFLVVLLEVISKEMPFRSLILWSLRQLDLA